MAGCISPDGKYLYYVSTDPRTKSDIIRMNLDGSNRSETVLGSEFQEFGPAISPDGLWLAFGSTATGSAEVYALDLLTSERVRISGKGGSSPRWAGNGELIYVTQGNTLASVKPRVAGRWDDVVTTDLFTARFDINDFEVMPGGQSFLIADWKPDAADAHIHLVTGW